MNPHPNLSGYQITEELYIGTRTLVYRGIRTNDQQPVVIKLLRNEYPNFNEIILFRNQYTITKNLDFSHIIKPLTLEVYQNSYALVMEDFGGISLSTYRLMAKDASQINKILPIAEFLQIAIQLTVILHYLYQNRIIHKDIKPANILINPDTKEVKLIDFSISSLLPRETQEIQNPNVLEGTLAYISPEQTGRMNRGIDYRSDFYSLGVTFYELLTGELPFVSADAMELVHCHLAKQAITIHDINPQLPLLLSEIVSKLMAKNAEDRYQTALGIKHDLEICLEQLQTTGKIETFKLGQRDISDRFIIPDKLYGREAEVKTLLQAFERVANPPIGGDRGVEIMLVAGFSGIGKTAIINEVHKPIVRQRGYFIKGKFDQFQRNIPLSAFVQAFRDLIGQLLTESDAQIQQWKTQILSALGDNGQVIIEVIPELEIIIGQQPPTPELSGSAAQNRFNLLFQKFTQVFTSAEHPLVIFLDDLQWADSASLNLMQLLIADIGHLLLIGAYRDNEVNPGHPLMLTLSEMQKKQATINTITLAPLNQVTVNQLIADTLKCPESSALPLSQLVFQKTKGNPFFATQFLKALYQDGLIQFTPPTSSDRGEAKGGWQCDIAQVNQLAVTDDVVAFMALQLGKLPTSTQKILQLAGCIGNHFDLATLAIVSEQSEVETAGDLWKALQEGLILPLSDVYKFYQEEENERLVVENENTTKKIAKYRFLHDRVQQAAYSLIPSHQKTATHLKIGQLLQQNLSELEREKKLFDIVGHLNLGIELITQPSECQALAQLNLQAGVKARNSTAYAAARVYLQTGIKLLETNCWQHQYELTLNLYVMAGEIAYLNGDFEGMEQIAELVLQEALTIFDKIKIYEVQIAAQVLQSNVLEAIAVGRKALGELGVELPTEADAAKTSKMLQILTTQLEGRQVEDLIDLPLMTDPTTQAALEVLGILFSPIIQGIPALLPWLSSMMVSLSLRSGNTAASITGYGIHGMVLCAFLEDTSAGYAFGKLALSLLEKFHTQKIKPIVLSLFGCFIQHSQERLDATAPTLKAAYRAGIETGDFLQAGFSLSGQSSNRFFSGEELHSLIQDLADYDVALAQVKQYSAQVYLNLGKQAAENLIELVSQPHCLIGNTYNETLMLPKHQQDHDLIAIAQAYIYKLLLAYYFGNYPDARNYISQAKLCLMAVSASIFVPIFHFYAALTYLALFPTQPESEQAELLDAATTHQKILHQWAQNAPMNHLHKWYLVEAERYRVLGEKFAASECYDRAINLAKEHQFVQEEALANELAAKFYFDWGKQRIAGEYMTNAYYGYTRWGAKAKVTNLETYYPQLLAPILQQIRSPLSTHETLFTLGSVTYTNGVTSSNSSVSVALDLAAILKASQTISGEIELSKLLSSLLSIVIENAGADKCVLMLLRDDRLLIKGSITVGTQPVVLQSLPVDDSQDIPLKLIYKVKHSRQTVVLFDATIDPTLANDPYIIRQQPQSILCSPILNQGQLIGVLYLENNVTVGAFTSDRIEVLNLICAQAAISLENARLYEAAQQALVDLKHAQLTIVQSEKMSALGNLVAGVAHEINNPVGFIAGNIQPALDYINYLLGLINLFQQEYPNYSAVIQKEIEAIDLEYIREDLPKLIGSMQEGVKRIQDISTSLRTFSRADTNHPVACNIHDGIDSTIMILKHRLKANENRPEIKVIKEYGNLPQIECYAGQLNQVFMNLLTNAIDAVEDSNQGRKYTEINNKIIVKTEFLDDKKQAIIRIKDNGIGMSAEVQSKIFNHLFTTKAVGKGTGLGLAIARQIVEEKHQGSITVNSLPSESTVFEITIPVK
ncbi:MULTISPECIES: trifunctional serine/threonine-protein kinase/ATP-binding protein/sensor histidine kinase [Kamptonema]|uniref:trifunctional serine/threonine-protein kinase/ATP-binding protein/sensor histidine kinase n=1 Tax=Kamptonema TaxID=1501433 RepID=UPI0001DACF2E|nr:MULTISPECIES: ATP-binding sensor histidine kinase [Kamptonema]CBN56975.1 ATP-binding region, ATPase-like [Kamptonema sp. PCC 6506]